MKIEPLSHYQKLHSYSESLPFGIDGKRAFLYSYLNIKKQEFNFPAVTPDVGSFLKFLVSIGNFKIIFEFGSGYGHSAFWFLIGSDAIEKIYLTEKRTDLKEAFEEAPWGDELRSKMDYFIGDAFLKLSEVSHFDLLLIDGEKASYLEFLKISENKMPKGGVVVIDNAFWRGSFLDEELTKTKTSAKKIKELHDYIKDSKVWEPIFLPLSDGLIVLRKKKDQDYPCE